MRSFADTITSRIEQLRSTRERLANGEEINLFVPTGLREWDNCNGIGRGELTVIGAMTGDGKSIVKLHLATHAAKSGLRVLMIDMEDPGAKTADRALSTCTGIDSARLEAMDLGDIEFEQLESALSESIEWASRITHFDGGLTTRDCLTLMEKAGTYDLILVDYAQAFPEAPDKGMERTIAEFAYEANELGKRTNAAVVVFSQLKASVEQRGYGGLARKKGNELAAEDVDGFAPSGLTDIAWAKELGEKARCILYLFRPGRVAERLGIPGVKDNRIHVIVGKRNFGRGQRMIFSFDGPTAAIRSLAA